MRYRIQARRTQTQLETWRVEADSRAEALRIFLEGDADYRDEEVLDAGEAEVVSITNLDNDADNDTDLHVDEGL